MGDTRMFTSAAHFDLNHSERLQIVEMPDALLPPWMFGGSDDGRLVGMSVGGIEY
jgi:hypothetical protein